MQLHTIIAAGILAAGLSTSAVADTVGVGTMSQGTLSFSTGSALAKVMNEKMGLEARVQPNSGESVLIPLVNSGELDFGIANVVEAAEASAGTGVFEGRKQANLRIAAVLYPLRTVMFVRDDSAMKTLEDLKGKRVTFGFSAMGSIDQVLTALLANGGMTPGDIEPVLVPNVVVGADQFMNGRADAFFFAVGAAKPAEVNASIPIRAIPMNADAESVARMNAIFPDGYIATVPPLPNFAGVKVPTPILAYDNLLLTNASVDDATVRAVLDGLKNNKDALGAAFPLFKGLDVAKLYKKELQAPFHDATIAWAAGQ